MAVLAFDNFQRADENPLSDGGNWSSPTIPGQVNPVKLVSHLVEGTAGLNCAANWQGNTFSNDQWSEITVANLAAAGYIGPQARALLSGAYTSYGLYAQGPAGSANTSYVILEVGGVQTVLSSTAFNVTLGDVLRISVQGTAIKIYQNGVHISAFDATDATLTSGYAGLIERPSVTDTDVQISYWRGGDFSAPNPTSILPTSALQGATLNVTVSGTEFDADGGATLSFSGTGITVNSYSVQNATTITANITISGSAPVGARNVIVTNASDGQTGTLSGAFTVTAPVVNTHRVRERTRTRS